MQMRTAVATKPLANLPANIIISYDSATIISNARRALLMLNNGKQCQVELFFLYFCA